MEQKYTRGVSWSTFEPTGKLGYCYLDLPNTHHNNISTNRSFLLVSVLGSVYPRYKERKPHSISLTMGF